MELYAQVRRSVFVEGLSEREAAKRFGLARGDGAQDVALRHSAGLSAAPTSAEAEAGSLHRNRRQILIDDQGPKKQRHTAKRIFDRLRDEYDFTGGYTIVKDVRDKSSAGKRCSCRWFRRAMPRRLR